MSLTGIYGSASIPTEQHFCSQLLFHSDQSGGSSCMTWDSGGLLNCTILSHKANDQVFGYKNASIQSLLHQLLVDTTGIRIDMRSPKNYGPVSQSTDTVTAEVSDDYEQHHVSLDKITVTAKRSLNLIEEEGVAKRAHNQDVASVSGGNVINIGELGMTMRQEHITINIALMGSEAIFGKHLNHKNVQSGFLVPYLRRSNLREYGAMDSAQ
ncbi:hypothetical protein D1007_03465 [Hordeum vulgare]|nr:hypothetical protein D1007_03465 [Hordeum vulgare]